jgi:hypothetical protein
MKMSQVPSVPMSVGPEPVQSVQPVQRTRRPPPPQPRADTAGAGQVATGRGVVPQKPHNPANQLAAMPTSGKGK